MLSWGAPGSMAWTGTLASLKCQAAHGERKSCLYSSTQHPQRGPHTDSASRPVAFPCPAELLGPVHHLPTDHGPSLPQMPAWIIGGGWKLRTGQQPC